MTSVETGGGLYQRYCSIDPWDSIFGTGRSDIAGHVVGLWPAVCSSENRHRASSERGRAHRRRRPTCRRGPRAWPRGAYLAYNLWAQDNLVCRQIRQSGVCGLRGRLFQLVKKVGTSGFDFSCHCQRSILRPPRSFIQGAGSGARWFERVSCDRARTRGQVDLRFVGNVSSNL